MNPTLNALNVKFATFWQERNPRERSLLAAAFAVIVLGLFYALLIDPALSGRKDMEKKLPALREQAAEVQALSKEAGALAGKGSAPAAAVTRESIESALNNRGLKPQSVIVTGELTKVQLNGASFSGIVDWLTEMQKSARLSVVDANVDAQAKADTVNATLTLRQQRSESTQ
ncbi:type II secretion system protein GspM [Noviherbaspirillum sp. UKPF54]|uniref:type II secretion system protein GspM n=1 Tax=Noviherbaspirillum sp. UKPF54 TaxID=2601898 RepID=UPI0011B14F54|nr:type II secretion system protein M [Noviherbaspirillum sp. UKPF54]QDZ29145.1 type II secretion system protein M [Noviherbaspirillum sp. UKPF54]